MKISDEQIVAAIISCSTNKQAAEACGLSEKQFYNRLSRPELKEKLAAARAKLLECATSSIAARVSEAVEVISNIMHSSETTAQTRLNAADAIIRNSLKMGERTDVLERIAELEKTLDALEDEHR